KESQGHRREARVAATGVDAQPSTLHCQLPRLVRLDPDLPTVELRDLVLQPLRRHVSPVVNETDGAARAGATDVDDVLTCRFVESAAIVGDLEGDLVRAGLERVTQLLAGTEVHAV